jgi:hypothetical protein
MDKALTTPKCILVWMKNANEGIKRVDGLLSGNKWTGYFYTIHSITQHSKKMGVCSTWTIYNSGRVIRKVRKTQHENPEFGHTQGEIQKNRAKKYISIWRGMKLRKPSILVVNWVLSFLSFFLSATAAATYSFIAPNCTTTIISLEPCALNAEYDHFILRFIKMSLLSGYCWKRV